MLRRLRLLPTLLALTLTARGEPAIPVQTLFSHDALTAGAAARIAVVLDLAKPLHINANPPTLPEMIPVVVKFTAPTGLAIGRITYPPGEIQTVTWAEVPVALYSGHIVILAECTVAANATPGPVTLTGTVSYQACDDQVCYAPREIPLTFATRIVAAGTATRALHPEIFGASTAAPAPPSAAPKGELEDLVAKRGWIAAFIFIFLGGLALNLTPCVYPMIAITVSYFGGQGEKKVGAAFAHALTYCAGLVLTYSTLGLVAALTGGLFGALLQSPVVIVGIALLLVALALSMFGLYEIQPPQFLLQRATGLSSKAGVAGVFFLGALVGIIAAPCLAPILVALLVFVGQRGDPWLGWWLFFVLACGLGVPYVLLGTFSGLLVRLPKAGMWMVWVKRVFGVALVIVAFLFIRPLLATHAAPSLIPWQPYREGILASAAGKPVLMDFAAEWCGPCRQMDATTFRDPRVVAKSKDFFMVKADMTKQSDPHVEALRQRYHIVGVPTLILIGPDGREHTALRQVKYTSADELLRLMDAALKPAPTNTTAAAAGELPAQLLRAF